MAKTSVAKRAEKKVLKYNKKASCEYRRLPFVGKGEWDVPATGGYQGGCEMGRWAAIAFMKFLRSEKEYLGSRLQGIVLAMMGEKEINDSRRGQVIGFFSQLNRLLYATAQVDDDLDAYCEEDLADAMTRAVNFDEVAWDTAMQTIDGINGKSIFIPFQAYQPTQGKVPVKPTQGVPHAEGIEA